MVRARTPWLAGMSAAACPLARGGGSGAAAPASTSSTSLLASAAYGALLEGARELREEGRSRYAEGGASRDALKAAFD